MYERVSVTLSVTTFLAKVGQNFLVFIFLVCATQKGKGEKWTQKAEKHFLTEIGRNRSAQIYLYDTFPHCVKDCQSDDPTSLT